MFCDVTSSDGNAWPNSRSLDQTYQWLLLNNKEWNELGGKVSVASNTTSDSGGCQRLDITLMSSNESLWVCPLPDGSLVFPHVPVHLNNTYVVCSINLPVGNVRPRQHIKHRTKITVLPSGKLNGVFVNMAARFWQLLCGSPPPPPPPTHTHTPPDMTENSSFLPCILFKGKWTPAPF